MSIERHFVENPNQVKTLLTVMFLVIGVGGLWFAFEQLGDVERGRETTSRLQLGLVMVAAAALAIVLHRREDASLEPEPSRRHSGAALLRSATFALGGLGILLSKLLPPFTSALLFGAIGSYVLVWLVLLRRK